MLGTKTIYFLTLKMSDGCNNKIKIHHLYFCFCKNMHRCCAALATGNFSVTDIFECVCFILYDNNFKLLNWAASLCLISYANRKDTIFWYYFCQ